MEAFVALSEGRAVLRTASRMKRRTLYYGAGDSVGGRAAYCGGSG